MDIAAYLGFSFLVLAFTGAIAVAVARAPRRFMAQAQGNGRFAAIDSVPASRPGTQPANGIFRLAA